MTIEEIERHVAECKICTAANKRVNDFCTMGRLMFTQYTQDHPPVRVEEVNVTDDQYARMIAERDRAKRQ